MSPHQKVIKDYCPNPYFKISIQAPDYTLKIKLIGIVQKYFNFDQIYDYFFDVIPFCKIQRKQQFKKYLLQQKNNKTKEANFLMVPINQNQKQQQQEQNVLINYCHLQIMKVSISSQQNRQQNISFYKKNHQSLYKTIQFSKNCFVYPALNFFPMYPEYYNLIQLYDLQLSSLAQQKKKEQFDVFQKSLVNLIIEYQTETKNYYPNLDPESILFDRKKKTYCLRMQNPLLYALGVKHRPMNANQAQKYRPIGYVFDMYASHIELLQQIGFIEKDQFPLFSLKWRYLNCLYYFREGKPFLAQYSEANNIFQTIELIQQLALKIQKQIPIFYQNPLNYYFVPSQLQYIKYNKILRELLGNCQLRHLLSHLSMKQFQSQKIEKQIIKERKRSVLFNKGYHEELKRFIDYTAQLSKEQSKMLLLKGQYFTGELFNPQNVQSLYILGIFYSNLVIIEYVIMKKLIKTIQLKLFISLPTQIDRKIQNYQKICEIKKFIQLCCENIKYQLFIKLKEKKKMCKLICLKIMQEQSGKLFEGRVINLSKIEEKKQIKFVFKQAYRIILLHRFNLNPENHYEQKNNVGPCINKILTLTFAKNYGIECQMAIIEIIVQFLKEEKDTFSLITKNFLIALLTKTEEKAIFFKQKLINCTAGLLIQPKQLQQTVPQRQEKEQLRLLNKFAIKPQQEKQIHSKQLGQI